MNAATKLFCCGLAAVTSAWGEDSRPNILFIAVDDLKPVLGCYGDTVARTPEIDRLAAGGMVFLNAHCQQAVCGPSRASLLSGFWPDQTRVWDLQTRMRDQIPEVVTLPQFFRENGYECVGMGKVFDPRSVDGRGEDDPASWSRPFLHPKGTADGELGYINPGFVAKVREQRKQLGGAGSDWSALRKAVGDTPSTEGSEDVPDEAYDDGAIAAEGVKLLGELSAGDKPFFLAVGFKKPHLPFVAPKKYWDLYERENFELAAYRQGAEGAPAFATQPGWELRSGYDVPDEGPIPDDKQRELIHGYHACVSYIDAQVGKLVAALGQSGEADNTVVILWGDHGFHLGDHAMWCKHSNYEQATRSPLIIVDPRIDGNGGRSGSPVDFVDIYPTLADLAGLPVSKNLSGVSLRPVLEDSSAKVKPVATSQYPRQSGKKPLMGYAVRDERYRLVHWVVLAEKKGSRTDEVLAVELYDYRNDPLETKNLAEDPAHKEVREKLAGFLEEKLEVMAEDPFPAS